MAKYKLAAGKAALLLSTHVFGLPLFLIPAFFRVPSLSTLAAFELAGSIIWHVLHAGRGAAWFEEYVPLRQAQILDHSMNILYISWLVSYVYALGIELKLAYMFTNVFFVILMAHNLVDTAVMYIYLGVSILTIIGFRLALPRKQYPLARIDAFLFGFAFVVAAPGFFFYGWSHSVYDSVYWWSHSIWHAFVYIGGDVLNLVIFEFRIAKLFGLEPLITRAKIAILEHVRIDKPEYTLADVNALIADCEGSEAKAAKQVGVDLRKIWQQPPGLALALAGDAVVAPTATRIR